MKKILFTAFMALLGFEAFAQNATNSPYSRYGFGSLADQSNGVTTAMGGTHLGLRESNQINFGNAASYSALDSLTFLFDASVSLQLTNFKEGEYRKNANNSSFDYVIGAFRLCKHLGMAFGTMPFSTVGYKYYDNSLISVDGSLNNQKTTVTNTYSGSGGYRQVFIGLGAEPIHSKTTSISFGANVSYMWGSTLRSVVNSYSDSYVKTLSKYYYHSINTMKVDLSAQVEQMIGKNDKVTLGLKYTPGHDMGGSAYSMVISNNSSEDVSDTTQVYTNGKMALPTEMGAGIMWNHANRLKVGMDFSLTKWSSVKMPVYVSNNGKTTYDLTENQLMDCKHISVGADYVGEQRSRKWRDHVHLRAGAYYNSPYLKINGADGPKEFGLSCGLGLPIVNAYNNRSMVNISAQWSHLSAKDLIVENTFRITIGLTFNERWFAKWKLE